jgi:hypothetical protein
MAREMRLSGSLFSSVSVCLCAALSCNVPVAAMNQFEAKPPVMSIFLRAKQNAVKAGDPVIVERTLTNRSDQDVTLARDVYHPGCAVDVVIASGNFAADKKLGYRHGRLDLEQLAQMSPEQVAKSGLLNGKLVWIKLKPGEAWVETCDASSFYDLARPGQYRITADLPDPESGIVIRSNAVEVTVAR